MSYIQQPRPEQLAAMKKIHKVKRVLIHGDVGVGKTKIAVDFIAKMIEHGRISKALIVLPLEAIGVWEEQFSYWPHVSYSLYLSNERVNWDAQVIIINYDYLCPRRKKKKPSERSIKNATLNGTKIKVKHFVDKVVLESVVKWNPSIVVLDESHKIKRPSARRSKAIHRLGQIAEYTICLTGTPLGNRKVMDLWSQFKFIKGDLLCEWDDFKHRYGIWGGFQNFQLLRTKNIKELSKIISPYIIRIRKTGLPEQNFIRYPVVIPPQAKNIYHQMAKEFVAYVEGQNVVASIVITKMMKLSQISGGFIKNEKKEDLPVHRAKLDALSNILEELQENGTTRVVIFARFLWELAEIKKVLEHQRWTNIYRVKGRILKEAQDKFNSEGGVMLCQTASGSSANNFQTANYMIFYSTDYSYINFNQAIGRIHRIGQNRPCFYYFLLAKNTIDNKIYNLLMENKDMVEELDSLIKEIKNDY